MPNSKKSRVSRGEPPDKPIKRTRYKNVLPLLLRDFDSRCAYSMQHTERVGKFEVDHFDPRQKKNLIQDYSNLFPSTRHCNGKKNDIWPSKEEVRCGCRFLNPCEEIDYGEQLFENYQTHFLFGVTPAAKWHIRVLGLNADHLVNERRKRFEYWFLIQKRSLRMKPKTDPQDFLQISEAFRKEVELMIPNIPEK